MTDGDSAEAKFGTMAAITRSLNRYLAPLPDTNSSLPPVPTRMGAIRKELQPDPSERASLLDQQKMNEARGVIAKATQVKPTAKSGK